MLLLCSSLLCCAGCADGKDMLLSAYEKTISSLGDFQRTDSFLLRGTREDGEDAYTGTYTATCKKTRAKDVVFGGCSIESRDLSITGTVGAQNNISRQMQMAPFLEPFTATAATVILWWIMPTLRVQ